MTTITATPDNERGTIALELALTAPVTGLIRADANGTRPVRTSAGTFPTASSGTLSLVDHEAALTGAVQYRVQDAAPESTAVWTRLAGGRPRFILPSVPVYAVIADIVTEYTASRTSRSTVHEVINRQDPLIALGRLRTRRGTLAIITDTHRQAQALEEMFERGQVTMYRQAENPGMDMYLVASAVDVAPVPEAKAWRTMVTYIEVIHPLGDLLTRPDWTFQELAATGWSFDQVAQDYRSFVDLALGEAEL